MKYIAVFDDKNLSNFRVDEGGRTGYEKVLVVRDKMYGTRGIGLRPLPKADIKKILEITKHKSQAYKFGFIDGFDYYEKILKEFGGENVLGETE